MNKIISMFAFAITINTLHTNAQAQDTQENESPNKSTEVVDFGKTIVTANKIEENLADVPASITVVSDLDIEDKGMNDIADVIQQVPNMSGYDIGYSKGVNSRGLNTSIFTQTNPVVLYVDGIPQYNNNDYDYSVLLSNAERVEVLRGPQGTLYGKDTIGGVINVVSKTPENEWQGRIALEAGSNTRLKTDINANGALVEDKAFLNIGVQADKDDGWITNDYDDTDAKRNKNIKFNSTLTVKPVERLTAKLTLNASKNDINFADMGAGDFKTITRDQAKHANFETPFRTKKNIFTQALNIEYDFDTVKLSSLTTNQKSNSKGAYDLDAQYDPANKNYSNGLYQFQNVENTDFNQEFKLSSNANNDFKWVAGVYYETAQINNKKYGYQFPYVDQKQRKYLGNFEQDVPSTLKSQTTAVFAQGSYDITDAVAVTLGGRYQNIDREIDLKNFIFPITQGKTKPSFSRNEEASWDTFLPKFALSYAFNDDLNTYFSYSQGYMPGGLNYFPNTAKDNLEFGAQKSDNYEIGMHGNFLNGKLNVNSSLFYMNINDIHLYKDGMDENGQYFNEVTNGGKGESKGIEVDARYKLENGLSFNMAMGFIDAKYTQHTNKKFNGNTITNTPKYTLNAGVAYFHPQGFYGRVDVNGKGDIYFDDANTKKETPWVNANTKIGYDSGNINIYGYVNNITNEEHFEFTRLTQNYFNPPRHYGVGLSYAF